MPALALTSRETAQWMRGILERIPECWNLPLLASDELTSESPEDPRTIHPATGRLAYLQYSSGSTGNPKGVLVSYDNLLANIAMMARAFQLTPDSELVSWTPPYHDMGLVAGILLPVFGGWHCTLMEAAAVVQRPLSWLRAISRRRATISGGPNFGYELCVRRATPEQLEELDLSCWSAAYNAAEPVRPDTLARFSAVFAPCGFRHSAFRPCYGLAEATALVTAAVAKDAEKTRAFKSDALMHKRVVATTLDDAEGRTLVSCGRAAAGVRIEIVNPDSSCRAAPDEVGEVWLSGPNVAQGYWREPKKTRASFRAFLSDAGEGPFLRTGDLGFLHGSELFLTGRLKDLIIIRGRNYHPQDLEAAAEQSHPAIAPGGCAAFSIDCDDEQRLVILAEVVRQYSGTAFKALNVEAVIRAIRQNVSQQFDLRVHRALLLRSGTLPKTSSGKVRRRASRDAYLRGQVSAWMGPRVSALRAIASAK